MSHHAGESLQDGGIRRRLAAWSVHLLTSLGAVLAVLALEAAVRRDWREFFMVLAASCLIDAVDGTLARWLRVKDLVPEIDGALLDNLVDFLNYALVPAFFLLRGGILPPGSEGWAAGTVMMASCYQFSQTNAKTPDHFFRGFPSYWNIVILYLLVSGFTPETNLQVVLGLGVMVFVPVKYIYPSRTQELQDLTLLLTSIWGLMIGVIIWTLPTPSPWLVGLSWFYVVYYVAASLWLNLRENPPA